MKKLATLFAFALVAFTANAQFINGDINYDGSKNITDVMLLVDEILTGSKPKSYLTCPDDNHPHMIDLGLPSGTKWACCNVDADKPEAYGGYYAWGETETKKSYGKKDYKYYQNGSYIDIGKDIAGTSYDVAHVKWGDSWVMPNHDQISELVYNCSYMWTILNGVEGGKFIGPNGGSIFLPAAGYDGGNMNAGWSGMYWSSIVDETISSSADILDFDPNKAISDYGNDRSDGQCVRPVCVTTKPLILSENNFVTYIGAEVWVRVSGSGSYSITCSNANVKASGFSEDIIITALKAGSSVITVKDRETGISQKINVTIINLCPDDHHPHMIDLGMPSGTKWACCNVDASYPVSEGSYYAWGETETHRPYNWSKYSHCDGSEETCHDIGSDIAGTQYDVAHVKWGGTWVMPNVKQIEELINNSSFKWVKMNYRYGHLITGQNGNMIFLPAGGYITDNSYKDEDIRGYYWSSSFYPSYSQIAYDFKFLSGRESSYWFRKCYGLNVRPVTQ